MDQTPNNDPIFVIFRLLKMKESTKQNEGVLMTIKSSACSLVTDHIFYGCQTSRLSHVYFHVL